eukprot:CAMPEP_0206835336 /NCGR_PEP_ID=MMETSP0975-20121206/19345_1 /ASSEMBLY_ACC=CAM_ASM_000399 /TAXON_ID=483370 /ORGANISM="non described non described, Strain CCMP2097" /LENGTH=69 /DNA_ID=CAMNT_0054377735 /DNA_START=55 /DNA_END=260 /DNA_ORIENTATION=-
MFVFTAAGPSRPSKSAHAAAQRTAGSSSVAAIRAANEEGTAPQQSASTPEAEAESSFEPIVRPARDGGP